MEDNNIINVNKPSSESIADDLPEDISHNQSTSDNNLSLIHI